MIRRGRVEIWMDILEAVQTAERKDQGIPPSRIQSNVNLPHTRFWRHIKEMELQGLLHSEPLQTTHKGKQVLSSSDTLRAIMDGQL